MKFIFLPEMGLLGSQVSTEINLQFYFFNRGSNKSEPKWIHIIIHVFVSIFFHCAYSCAVCTPMHPWSSDIFFSPFPVVKTKYLQVNDYEIVVIFFRISHNFTWYSASVHKFTRIYPVCSTYELIRQFK